MDTDWTMKESQQTADHVRDLRAQLEAAQQAYLAMCETADKWMLAADYNQKLFDQAQAARVAVEAERDALRAQAARVAVEAERDALRAQLAIWQACPVDWIWYLTVDSADVDQFAVISKWIEMVKPELIAAEMIPATLPQPDFLSARNAVPWTGEQMPEEV